MTQQPTVFLRRASGLVRDWSIFDAAFSQAWALPLTFGAYTFTYAAFWPNSNLVLAIILLTVWMVFQCLVYSFLVVTIPRSGSDYVWQSRILHPVIGFGTIFPGWLAVLPMFITINTYIFLVEFISPALALLGQMSAATWAMSYDAVFIGSILTLVYTFAVCAIGLRWYARVQAIFFYLALIGTVLTIAALGLSSNGSFVTGLNSFYQNNLGYNGANAYQDIINAAQQQGLSTSLNWSWMAAFPLVPLMTYFGIYPTWSSPMYGEVRDVNSVHKTHLSFQMANVPLNILNILLVVAVWNSAGFKFFQSASYLFWLGDSTHMPLFPSIPFWVYFSTGSLALTLFILLFNLAFGVTINGMGNGYYIVSRMMFAMSFDQALPSWFASLKTKRRIPVAAYVYVLLIGTLFSWLYSYNILNFRIVWLDSVFPTLVGIMVTIIAATVLPFRRRELFSSSPASRFKIGGLPLITLFGLIWIPFGVYTFYLWAVDPTYGVNNVLSAQFLVIVYIAAVLIYYAFKRYRKTQGVDLNLTYREIPAE